MSKIVYCHWCRGTIMSLKNTKAKLNKRGEYEYYHNNGTKDCLREQQTAFSRLCNTQEEYYYYYD